MDLQTIYQHTLDTLEARLIELEMLSDTVDPDEYFVLLNTEGSAIYALTLETQDDKPTLVLRPLGREALSFAEWPDASAMARRWNNNCDGEDRFIVVERRADLALAAAKASITSAIAAIKESLEKC